MTLTKEPVPPAFPDYYLSPDAVLHDTDAHWRFGRKPDYSKTRKMWLETKEKNHVSGSLEELVENLVKNWEIEASYKPRAEEWRTINHEKYTFSVNGSSPQPAESMAKVGTYNALIEPNMYYSPEHMDFAASHKTFKRMMPTFAWEVLDVYSGPPKVALRWRHWGWMEGDYTGTNSCGEKIKIKAHGKKIDIKGVTVAEVDDQFRITSLDTYFDPMDMFRQMETDEIPSEVELSREAGDKETVAPVRSGQCPFATQWNDKPSV